VENERRHIALSQRQHRRVELADVPERIEGCGSNADDASIRPFHVDIPQKHVDDLRRRIRATRWPEKETVGDASQGVQLATTQALVSYC
jgi:hypothetical protein